jgi:hypothetical protein
MKARELPENPNEESELLHEMTDIACEDAGGRSVSKSVSSLLAATTRRAVAVLSSVSRASGSLVALMRRPLRRHS